MIAPRLVIRIREEQCVRPFVERAGSVRLEIPAQGFEEHDGPCSTSLRGLDFAIGNSVLHEQRALPQVFPSERERFAWPQACVGEQ